MSKPSDLTPVQALLGCVCWRRRRAANATPAGASVGAHPQATYAAQPAWPGPHTHQVPAPGRTYVYPSGRVHDERVREEQELALALAASKREAELAAQRAQQAPPPVWGGHGDVVFASAPRAAPVQAHQVCWPPSAALGRDGVQGSEHTPHDRRTENPPLHTLAQDDEDAQLRAAIAESLRLQQQTQQWNPWRG